MIICEIDKKEFANGGVMAKYLKKKYNITYREYYHKYVIKTEESPKCKCGCGKELMWSKTGYNDYLQYHLLKLNNKLNNSWGKNPEAVRKSAETRRSQFASGERVMWSKGKSIKTNTSLQSAAAKLSARYTTDIRSEYSERMKRQRKDGTIPTLFGKESSRWQGGVSSVNQIARASTKLYKEWKYPILNRDGFKCTQCPNTKDLHVHHDKETFSEIIKKVMTIDDYEKLAQFDHKKEVADRVIDYHINNKITGTTLCASCHNKLHPSLNFL